MADTTTPRDTEADPAAAAELAPIVHPSTGEVLELTTAPAPHILDELDELRRLEGAMRDYREALELELVGRVDAHGARTVELDGCKLKVNAPTEDHYDAEAVRRELEPLVEAGKVPGATLTALIIQPEPVTTVPPERVDKRRVNGLKSSDNRELLAALARARRRVPTRRKVEVLGRPIDSTAEEVGGNE